MNRYVAKFDQVTTHIISIEAGDMDEAMRIAEDMAPMADAYAGIHFNVGPAEIVSVKEFREIW